LGLPQSGKVVAVRFWADWCPFCENEMQAIEPVYQKYRGQGLVILAVNVRQDRGTTLAFMEKLDVSYAALLDEDGVVARDYGVMGLPTTFFIDRDGRVAGRILGESTAEVFAQMVEKIL
jgi:thiol-disulfide isomerase/thioredoxin